VYTGLPCVAGGIKKLDRFLFAALSAISKVPKREIFDRSDFPEAVDMNGRFQMQGGKNWFLPKEMNANRFFWDSHWLEIWSNHFYPSMGPNGGSVAMDSDFYTIKSLRVGDFGVKKKKKNVKIFRGSFRGAKFLMRMLSLFLRRFFF
jgi:hypothetical protein